MSTASTPYSAGIDRVTESPMGKAADQIQRMQAGINAAFANGYTEKRLRASSLAAWKQKAKTKGASALAQSATQALPKYQQYAAIAQPIVQQAQAQIKSMPKGGDANATARFQAMLAAMHQVSAAYRGTQVS